MSKGILIPSRDEFIEKYKRIRENEEIREKADFINKANECKVGEKIATMILNVLKDDPHSESHRYCISLGCNIYSEYAQLFISTVVKPMFEEKGWKISNFPTEGFFCHRICYWKTKKNEHVVENYPVFDLFVPNRGILIILE